MATQRSAKPLTRVRFPSLPSGTKVQFLILNDYYGLFGRVVSVADAIAYWGEHTTSGPNITWIAALDPVDKKLKDQPQPWNAINVEVVTHQGHLKRWLDRANRG